jgi:hypothetical protein
LDDQTLTDDRPTNRADDPARPGFMRQQGTMGAKRQGCHTRPIEDRFDCIRDVNVEHRFRPAVAACLMERLPRPVVMQ